MSNKEAPQQPISEEIENPFAPLGIEIEFTPEEIDVAEFRPSDRGETRVFDTSLFWVERKINRLKKNFSFTTRMELDEAKEIVFDNYLAAYLLRKGKPKIDSYLNSPIFEATSKMKMLDKMGRFIERQRELELLSAKYCEAIAKSYSEAINVRNASVAEILSNNGYHEDQIDAILVTYSNTSKLQRVANQVSTAYLENKRDKKNLQLTISRVLDREYPVDRATFAGEMSNFRSHS